MLTFDLNAFISSQKKDYWNRYPQLVCDQPPLNKMIEMAA